MHSHLDLFAYVLLVIGLMTLFALIGRALAKHFGQPTVVGELLIGVVIGNIGYWFGVPAFVAIMHLNELGEILRSFIATGALPWPAVAELSAQQATPTPISQFMIGEDAAQTYVFAGALWLFANLGVVFLMFTAGLGSSIGKLNSVRGPAVAVGIVGVLLPVLLGFVAMTYLLPETDVILRLFVGATLAATSVGVSASVFDELGVTSSRPASIVLGAAVIDDILAMVLLATVMGVVVSGVIDYWEIATILLLATGFLGFIVIAGDRLVKLGIPLFERLDRLHVKLLYAIFVLCVISILANALGLAIIVGAFAAGLLLRDEYFHTGESRPIKELIAPLEIILAPVFFVLIGMQVNLQSVLSLDTLALIGVLTVAAVIGKLAAGFAATGESSRLAIGVGMIPRGEVGIIFAGIGNAAGLFSTEQFTAIVIVIFATTVIAPVALKTCFSRWPPLESL
ncbi:MAG: cation:proton antiporter [Pseudomonadota bacterium]